MSLQERPNAEPLVIAAQAFAHSGSLESLTRPFLDVLHSLTGLESTYLTEVRPAEDEQTILFSDNRGGIEIPEGLTVDWQDTLCRRALESGKRCTSDVEEDLPGSAAAKALGLQTYVSVPVVSPDQSLMGTLCGASGEAVKVSPGALDVMEMLARLIGDQWDRERQRARALERAESAERQLLERANFLAEAEHKLKSPLTVLRGWSDMLEQEWDSIPPDTRATAISTIHRASIDASRQLDQLLEVARSEVLSSRMESAEVQLIPLIDEIGHQLSGVASTTGHTVVVEENSAPVAVGDKEALWQVLWHLGDNALKYSPGGGQVTLSSSIDEDCILISISDEGMGVPENTDVFAPFKRGSGNEMTGIPGTGLGLHIVRNFVEAMGGSITAERRPQGGSVFAVRLPSKG